MGTGRKSEDRRIGGAAAVGAALLVVLLFAAPILFLRISEARQRLDALLRRTHAVKAHEEDRLASARSAFDRQVEESARSQDEELEYVETRIDRMLPRAVSEVRLPDALPLPRDVAPAVQPHEAAPAPEAAVAAAGTNDPAPPAAADGTMQRVVASWLADLTRALGLAPSQQDLCSKALTDYAVRLHGRLSDARAGKTAGAMQDIEGLRQETIERIQGGLTAEQVVVYEKLKKNSDQARSVGLVAPPLPGTNVPRTK